MTGPRRPIPSWQAELVLLGITFIWGGTFAAVKGAVTSLSPFLFTGLRFTLALLVMALLWRGSFHRWERYAVRHGLLLGFLLAGGFVLQTLGLLYTTASRSAFITGTTVALVPFFQLLLQRRPVLLWEWIGAAVTLGGLWQLSAPGTAALWNLGDLLTMASTLFWGIYIVLLDSYTRTASPALGYSLRLTFLQFAVTAAMGFAAQLLAHLAGLSLPGDHSWWSSPRVWVALAYTTLLASLLAMLLQTHYQRYTTPVRATLIYALEPVFAALIAWGILGERLSSGELVGAGLILSGTALAQLPRLRRAHFLQQ
jgi:drug/metabolite transporter (DMT)-like permease